MLTLALTVALTAAPRPIALQSRGAGPDVSHEVAKILQIVDGREPPPLADLVRALVRLGPAGAEEIVAIYVGAVEPPDPGRSEAPAPTPAPTPEGLEAVEEPERLRREDVILEALRTFPPGEVVSAVRVRAMGEVAGPVRLMGIRALGEVGTARALEALLQSLGEFSEVDLARTWVAEPATAALAAILSDDEACWQDLRRRMLDPDPRIVPILVRGIGRTRSARGVPALAGLIEQRGSDKTLVLSAIDQLSEKEGLAVEEESFAPIRCELESEDLELRRTAIIVLGRLHDLRSIPRFVDLLASEDPIIARAAQWSLELMSGLSLPPESERWRDWHAEEMRWLTSSAPDLRRHLDSSDPAAMVEAIAELSQRRLFRHAMAEEIARTLLHAPEVVATAACAGLVQLRSTRAVPGLVQALRRPEDRVRVAAGEALVAITGKSLPPEFDVWVREVQP